MDCHSKKKKKSILLLWLAAMTITDNVVLVKSQSIVHEENFENENDLSKMFRTFQHHVLDKIRNMKEMMMSDKIMQHLEKHDRLFDVQHQSLKNLEGHLDSMFQSLNDVNRKSHLSARDQFASKVTRHFNQHANGVTDRLNEVTSHLDDQYVLLNDLMGYLQDQDQSFGELISQSLIHGESVKEIASDLKTQEKFLKNLTPQMDPTSKNITGLLETLTNSLNELTRQLQLRNQSENNVTRYLDQSLGKLTGYLEAQNQSLNEVARQLQVQKQSLNTVNNNLERSLSKVTGHLEAHDRSFIELTRQLEVQKQSLNTLNSNLERSLSKVTGHLETHDRSLNEVTRQLEVQKQSLNSVIQTLEQSFGKLTRHLEAQDRVLNDVNRHLQTLQTGPLESINKSFSQINRRLDGQDQNHQTQYELLQGTFISFNRPHDCNDMFARNNKINKVYRVYPSEQKATDVFCDMTTSGGPWLVFQRRQDGSVDFYRNWKDYTDGFGDLIGEFWLGNENLHWLTSTGKYKLRIDLEDWSGTKRYAEYSSFSIKSSSDYYRLNVSGYSGNAGDSFSNLHNGRQFSTKDADRDSDALGNCAEWYRGGWWYNWCYSSNLNGKYLWGSYYTADHPYGVEWYLWRRRFYNSLKATGMKVTRID